MGTCLMCHKKTRNGEKYCDSCKQKRKNKADESYLDSLLTSVGINSSVKAGRSAKAKVQDTETDNTAAYADIPNDSIDNGTYNTNTGNPEMDDMISDLLEDMDSNNQDVLQNEPEIAEEDLESIFDEAEAYATLLSKEGNQEEISEQVQPDENSSDFDELMDVEWKNDGSDMSIDSDVDALFDEVDAKVSQDPGQFPGDEQLNELDESLQGENAEQISVQEVFSDFDPIEEEISDSKQKKKKKLSWFKRLFGNTNDEVTPEMLEADRKKKEEDEKLDRQRKEEKKKQEEEKKAEAEAEKARKKAEAEAERNRKMALAAEKKAAEKEREKKKKETALAIAEYEMEHGKINKAGATILFVIFAILTIVIIIGTNIYSYNLSIKNAQEDFDIRKYNEAYYEVYGLKIQDEDIELYDKIMTVMYVNKQLNSYEYYMTSNNREKALDSLVKGLQRYDKYLQLAQRLGITDDLNYVKGEIVEKLASEFDMTEEDARIILTKEDAVDYSEYLYSLLGSYEDELEKYK